MTNGLVNFLFPRYNLDKTLIANDLTKERPLWILSAYGPGRNPPLQLFGGVGRELSFEELRLRHYELAALGSPQKAIQEAQSLVNNAEQQIKNTLDDIDGAVNYIVNGEKQHPNRHDICSQPSGGEQQHGSILAQPSMTNFSTTIPIEPKSITQTVSQISTFPSQNPGIQHVSGPPASFGQISGLNGQTQRAISNIGQSATLSYVMSLQGALAVGASDIVATAQSTLST